ncbi:hypothetical protein EJ03DRAFT_323741 [Teratosphaeria nubilosa]|uniref:Yeast cell wall synthesis Kre9/Knh1-like N-terminal domain-containing protein n=1 Tax=Teratosphaeria nubilosa TaxID=161662 RepID=A0A6G1LM37_9PEZI|nr:hypothetical protein EJ03DRAFT_323741 [Teratosphaeria nubilosa]
MFTKSLILGAFAGFAAAQSASLTFTSVPDSITEGQAVTLKYTTNDASSPVTITLRKGDSNNLQTVSTLTTDSTGGSYEWTPETSLESGSNYALQITQGSETNYYGPFSITGQNTSSSSSASPDAYGSSAPSANMTTPTTMPPAVGTVGTISGGTGTPMSRNTTMSTAALSSATHTGVVYTSAASTTNAGATPTSSTVATGAASVNVGSAALSILFGAAAVYFS